MAGAILAAVLAPGASAAQDAGRYAAAWQETLDGRIASLESGSREGFDGWDIAHPGGGVCNGDPACDGPEMTFVPTGAAAVAAATVRVAEGAVGDDPGSVTCEPPFSGFFPPAGGVERFAGCAYDGREFGLEVFRNGVGTDFRVLLEAGAPMCRKVTS